MRSEAPVEAVELFCAWAPLVQADPRKARIACWKKALWSTTVRVVTPRPKVGVWKLSSVWCASVLMLPSNVKLPPRKVTLKAEPARPRRPVSLLVVELSTITLAPTSM